MDITLTIRNVDPQHLEAAARGMGWTPTVNTRKTATIPNDGSDPLTHLPEEAIEIELLQASETERVYAYTVEEQNPLSALEFLQQHFVQDFLARVAEAAAAMAAQEQEEAARQTREAVRQQLTESVQVEVNAQ